MHVVDGPSQPFPRDVSLCLDILFRFPGEIYAMRAFDSRTVNFARFHINFLLSLRSAEYNLREQPVDSVDMQLDRTDAMPMRR